MVRVVLCLEDERCAAFFVTPIVKGFYEKLSGHILLNCQEKYLLKTLFFSHFSGTCITQFPNRTILVFSRIVLLRSGDYDFLYTIYLSIQMSHNKTDVHLRLFCINKC